MIGQVTGLEPDYTDSHTRIWRFKQWVESLELHNPTESNGDLGKGHVGDLGNIEADIVWSKVEIIKKE